MDKRIIVLSEGVDKKGIANTSCCVTGPAKIRGE